MLLEQEIQGRFFSFVVGKEDIINLEKNRLGIYKDLVFYRFHEALKNVYPIFKEKIGNDVFNLLIRSFIKSKPQSPFIWKMPDDFRYFCLSANEVSGISFAKDLLLYEWTEVELLMSNYTIKETTPFSWDNSFKLSESSRFLRLTHRVYAGDFKTASPDEFTVILFYNFTEHKVYFQETTKFMFDLISSMGRKTALAAVSETALRYNVNIEDTRNIVFDSLNEFCHKKILVRV